MRRNLMRYIKAIYGKLSLKVDEPQVGQRHEDVERKREYYHIIIFPART